VTTDGADWEDAAYAMAEGSTFGAFNHRYVELRCIRCDRRLGIFLCFVLRVDLEAMRCTSLWDAAGTKGTNIELVKDNAGEEHVQGTCRCSRRSITKALNTLHQIAHEQVTRPRGRYLLKV
jgi:hypothetical protein